jgi:PAS domain S-box-containing protein
VIATAKPIRDPHGTLAGGIVIFRDITDQKLAQQTLEASEERFRAFMENLPAIAFIKDAAGRYVYGNRHFFEYHPTTPQELERAVKTDFELTAAESASALQANDRKVLAGSTPLHIDEQLINFQGQPTWFSVYKFRLTSVSGEHLVGGIAVDVTERRRDEQQLIADEQLLRKLIDLQERERTLVAHDIHDGFVQDVVGAKMISETIANRLDSKKDEKSKGQFVAIDDALGRAIAEARRLISELRPMVIDEEGIVEAIRYLISDSQYSKEMEITFIEKMGGMRLDPMLEGNLFRIVQEALNNALRHSDAATVSIHLNRDEEELTLTVTDNGIGFHPEAADANRFGLRGIRERARLFDGTATINSAPGQGTRIKVKMPLLVPKDPQPKA